MSKICVLYFVMLITFSVVVENKKRCVKKTVPTTPPTPVDPVPVVPTPTPVVPKPAPVVPVVRPTPRPVVPANPHNPAAFKPVSFHNGQCFNVVNVATGQALDANAGGLEVSLRPRNGSISQRVCIEDLRNGQYILHWKGKNGWVFDIFGGGNADGVRLIKYPRHGGANQRFRFRQNGNRYVFTAVNSGKAFGVYGGRTVQYSPNYSDAQSWYLYPA